MSSVKQNYRQVTTVIDPDLCIGCGACISVCPCETLSMQNGKALVTGDQSLSCGHCMAICPTKAVRVKSIDLNALNFLTFRSKKHWMPPGEFNIVQLVHLMSSRRSCRNYTDTPINKSLLEDLVKIATTAPSATNSQEWTFTILSTRNQVVDLGTKIARFFQRLNTISSFRYLRLFLKMIGKPEMEQYYLEYYETIKTGLEEWKLSGKDLLFHGATAAILIGATPKATCPKEDCLLATQNILLAAHAIGLGTCLIGFAVEAIKNDPSIKRFIEIPKSETIYAVIALGYPNENYLRPAGRKPYKVRFV